MLCKSKWKHWLALGSRLFINMAGVDNWRTCLNELKIFKQLRENNCTDSNQKRKLHSKSLVQVLDSDVYVWDGYAAQLLNYNLKNFSDSSEKKSRFQVVYIYIHCCKLYTSKIVVFSFLIYWLIWWYLLLWRPNIHVVGDICSFTFDFILMI